MCGFLITARNSEPPSFERARALLSHRGPDGFHAVERGRWQLAHSRLAVLDPTAAADQPFLSPDGRWALLFNGEIYNFRALRAGLTQRWSFRSTGDTEVLLAGLVNHGPEWLDSIEGMYAFALVDASDDSVLVARDPLGIKPLFSRVVDGRIVAMGSTVRAVRGSVRHLNPEALHQAILFGTPIALATAESDVTSIPPGASWKLASDGRVISAAKSAEHWWNDATEAPDPAAFAPALRATVDRHLVSDVPVGVALSGGLDSSTLVSLAVAAGQSPHCFTASFPDDERSRNDVDAAILVARHFDVPHTIVPVTSATVAEAVQRPGLWDEPFAEAAALPLNRVAASARAANVPVLLTGEGPDEFFGGYRRFERFRQIAPLPRVPDIGLTRSIGALTSRRVQRGLFSLGSARHSAERYLWLVANLPPRDAAAVLRKTRPVLDSDLRRWTSAANPFREVDALAFETKTVLSEFYLRKVDLATMAEGIEGRVPFVDTAFLKTTFTRTPARGKDALRTAMLGLLPREILERPKQGFGAPIGQWVRTVFRSDIEEVLSDAHNPIWGVLERDAVQALWRRPSADAAGYGMAFFAIYRWGRWCGGDIP